jgi:predicted hydrolase (HD superfamily)
MDKPCVYKNVSESWVVFFFLSNGRNFIDQNETKLKDQRVKDTSIYNLMKMNIREQAPNMNIVNKKKQCTTKVAVNRNIKHMLEPAWVISSLNRGWNQDEQRWIP